MEKKIIFTPVEPNRNLLWLHYRGDLLVLERFGSNGWESIGGTGSVTEEEFIEALKNKADLVSGKVPAEQLSSCVDDVIEFESIINGSNPINFYLNNQSYTDKVYYIQGSTSIEGTLSFKYNKKFINFGTNTSEDDWIIVEPEEGKIYIKIGSGNDSNHSFHWSGSDLIDLSVSTSTSSFQQLYTYIIDKTLLNTTITDTSIQDSIKRANILVVEDSTDSSYKVHIKGIVASNSIYFFNLQNANADTITATRVQFNTTTNLLNSTNVYLQSAFNAYKLGGGTKYTTESTFNTRFAEVMDA